jgi:hypothetical protein
VLEGNMGYTAVAGERTNMERGDFVITPNWAWHDHGQENDKPVIWIDGLDLHIVNFFETAFSEHSNDKMQLQARQMDAKAAELETRSRDATRRAEEWRALARDVEAQAARDADTRRAAEALQASAAFKYEKRYGVKADSLSRVARAPSL